MVDMPTIVTKKKKNWNNLQIVGFSTEAGGGDWGIFDWERKVYDFHTHYLNDRN